MQHPGEGPSPAGEVSRCLTEPLQALHSTNPTHKAACRAGIRQAVITITLCIPAACYKTIGMVLKYICNEVFILFGFFHLNRSGGALFGRAAWGSGTIPLPPASQPQPVEKTAPEDAQ